MSAVGSWFGGGSGDQKYNSMELESRGESPEKEEEEQIPVQLPDLTDEEVDRLKVEKAKTARRSQLDVILASETSLGSTITSLKKSLLHYEKEKMDLYAKRQKYRIVVANYKGPDNDVKLAAINKILHQDLPSLIDEIDDRLINGHAQLANLERQLNSIRQHRVKAEKAYQKLFDPLPEGDLEGGVDYDSEDSENRGKDTPIEVILAKYDSVNYPLLAPPIDPHDTSSDSEDGLVHDPKRDGLKIVPQPHSSLIPQASSSSSAKGPIRAISSGELVDVPLD